MNGKPCQSAENSSSFEKKKTLFSCSWTFLWNYLQDICLYSFKHTPVTVFLASNDQYVFLLFNFEPWLAAILLPCDVDFGTKRFGRRNSPPPGSRPPHSGFCLSPLQSQACEVLKNYVILIWAHDSITENRGFFLCFILNSQVEFLQYINLSAWSNIFSVSEKYIVSYVTIQHTRYSGYRLNVGVLCLSNVLRYPVSILCSEREKCVSIKVVIIINHNIKSYIPHLEHTRRFLFCCKAHS